MFIKYKKNKLDMPRFGFVVSAKVVGKAVERNKTRRIFSEAARDMIKKGLGGYDVIVFVTHKINIMSPKEDVVKDFLGVLKKIQ